MGNLADLIFSKMGIAADRAGLGDTDAQETIASLLALVANADGGISPEETARMVEMIRARFGCSANEALSLITRAGERLAGSRSLEDILGAVNQELSRAHKEDLMLMVLNVIAADNMKDAQEMDLLATLIDRLNVSHGTMESVYSRYFDARKEGG